jgi:hypothetical protein
MPTILEVAVIVDAATTDHEHDHGGFPNPNPGTALRLLSRFPALIIHPCLNALESPQV